MAKDDEEDTDPCTGFSTTHKAKLSIPTINWKKNEESSEARKSSKDSSRVEEKAHSHIKGLVLTLLSTITFSFNALIGKVLNHFHPFNLGFWIFLQMTGFSVLTLLYEVKVKKTQVFNEECAKSFTSWKAPICLLIRALTGTSALTFFFYAVKYLTVADVLVIDSSSPILVYLLAFFFFGEQFGIFPAISTIMAIAGVALITRPPLLTNEAEYDLNSLIGTVLAFSVTLCIAVQIIALKFLENVRHGIVNFTYSTWGTLECLIVAWLTGALCVPTESSDILKIVASGILFYIGQAFLTLALQCEDAGVVGLVRTSEVMFIFVWQFIFLGVVPDVFSCVGAFLVLVGTSLIILRRWISTLPSTSEFRNRCRVLLY